MFTRLQEEMDRQEARLDDKIFDDYKINSIHDIQRILIELDPNKSVGADVPISTDMVAAGESDRLVHYSVSAPTESLSKRKILIDGFTILKARQDLVFKAKSNDNPVVVNGREMKSPITPSIAAYSSIDPLIKRWFGGYRDGLLICWDLPEGKIVYDIFSHRLFKAKESDRG